MPLTLGGGLALRLAALSIIVNPNTAVDTWGGVGLGVGLLVTFHAMVLHKPGVSAGVPEGGEGPCRYVIGLVGPHNVRRWMASWFPSERRTSLYGDVFCPAPRGHTPCCHLSPVLSLSRVLPVTLVVEVALQAHIVPHDVGLEVGLLIIVELHICLIDLAEVFLGVAAFGPIVRAATELGFAIKVTASRELRFDARGTTVLETVLTVLVIGLLLIRVELLLVMWGFFRGDWPCGFILGDPPATSASTTLPSILAPRAGFRRVGTDPKLFETFGPLGALLPCFFSADVALANAPAALSSPPFVWRDGLMKGGVVGAMMPFT